MRREGGCSLTPAGTPAGADTELLARATSLLGSQFLGRVQALAGDDFRLVPPEAVMAGMTALAHELACDPRATAVLHARLWRDGAALWTRVLEARRTGSIVPAFPPAPSDRRFKYRAWAEDPMWSYLQQSYYLLGDWLMGLIEHGAIDEPTRRRLRFYMRQYVSALAPTNFAFTNPEVLRRVRETEGRCLVDGLRRFVDDLERGAGHLRIRQTDESAFRLGENLATTPGKVVFRNHMFELIQYTPATAEVFERPLLVVPPWINKYYILDLQPRNSLVKFAVDQGYTVFLVSWVNPTEGLAHVRFEDYLGDGVLAALAAVEAAIGVRYVNVLGFCIGGILAASAAAHLAAVGDDRIASATFLATLFDFDDVGEIGVFIDEAQVGAMETHAARTGFLGGHFLAQMFAMLRENDLIWSFFVNNYLLGKDPPAFDLLYWNADSTHLPATMLSDYLRGFYLANGFARPGTLTFLGTPIDTRLVTVPTYALATREDHIAPWRSCLAVTRQFRGPVRFVLGGSGHVAGIVNPPARAKYGFWTRDDVASADEWLDGATAHEGSWWTDWAAWLRAHGGRSVAARDPSAGGLAPIDDAPGTYVLLRTNENHGR